MKEEPTFKDKVMYLREILNSFPNEQSDMLGWRLALANMLAHDPKLIGFLEELSRVAGTIKILMDSDHEWNEKGLHQKPEK